MIYSVSFYSPQLLAGVRRSRAPVSPIHGEAPGDVGFGVARPVAALAGRGCSTDCFRLGAIGRPSPGRDHDRRCQGGNRTEPRRLKSPPQAAAGAVPDAVVQRRPKFDVHEHHRFRRSPSSPARHGDQNALHRRTERGLRWHRPDHTGRPACRTPRARGPHLVSKAVPVGNRVHPAAEVAASPPPPVVTDES
jgi:hypothetical protein